MRKKILQVAALFILLVLITAGCRRRVHLQPENQTKKLVRTGYVIQVGAFSVLDNAVRMTAILEDKGLEPYYFRHESGLYKVRFGDYSSRKQALERATALSQAAVIPDYYIVQPEEQPAAKADVYGPAYLRNNLVNTAEKFLGIPYTWGGTSPEDGFDCSGLTMTVYKLNGFNLPRNSRMQFRAGEAVSRADLKKGDLVFFATGNSPENVSHVGIYIGGGRFIHAPGRDARIRIDRLDEHYYKQSYAGARSYINP